MIPYTKFLWCSGRTLSHDALIALHNRFPPKPIEIHYFTIDKNKNESEKFHAILAEANRVKAHIIGGEFDTILTAKLIRSQTIGGYFGGFTIVLPNGSEQHWEVFL